jgi:phage-related protein
MSSIITSVKDLIASVFEVIFSVFRAAFNTTSQLIEAVVNSVIGTFKFVLHTIAGTLEAAGGVGKFIASKSLLRETLCYNANMFEGNIVVIALIAGGGYAYLRYQKSQGRPVRAGNKKLN